MHIGGLWCLVVVLASGVCAGKWQWPESGESLRIDTKVAFLDRDAKNKHTNPEPLHDDETPFREPSQTDGFYNRPPGSGRYPVRVEGRRPQQYRVDGHAIYPLNDKHNQALDGTLDSLQFCKCVSTTPDCHPRPNSEIVCGAGKFLCCYKRPGKTAPQNTEFFNEVEDERPMLLPGRENLARPFPPPPGSDLNGFFGPFGPGHGHDNSLIGIFDKQQQGVLVGPDGPSGSVGPQSKPNVLVGPEGPTGIIGPAHAPVKDDPRRSESAQRGVLVGPGGPTGIIGPAYERRPVLVGSGGPAGIIGNGRGGRGSNVLVGPGGPTGIIGPYSRPNTGILTGPGGPTGSIGPRRGVLVGPGGPTGSIGPQVYFGK